MVSPSYFQGLRTGTSGGKSLVFLVTRMSPWWIAVAASKESHDLKFNPTHLLAAAGRQDIAEIGGTGSECRKKRFPRPGDFSVILSGKDHYGRPTVPGNRLDARVHSKIDNMTESILRLLELPNG